MMTREQFWEIAGTVGFALLMLVSFGFLLVYCGAGVREQAMQMSACKMVCGDDPIQACYPNRAVCVGQDNIYVRSINPR